MLNLLLLNTGDLVSLLLLGQLSIGSDIYLLHGLLEQEMFLVSDVRDDLLRHQLGTIVVQHLFELELLHFELLQLVCLLPLAQSKS